MTTYTQIAAANGGRSRRVWTDGAGFWNSAVWSGQGDSLAVNGPHGVYIVNVSSGRAHRIAGPFWAVLAWQALPGR